MARQANVRLDDRVIAQWGSALPDDREGCELVTMTEAQELRHDELLEQPNGGIVLAADGALAALPVPAPDPITAGEQSEIDQYEQDRAIVRQFMGSVNGSATDAQRDAVLKAFVRCVRYLVNRKMLD